jgi:16S rRNA (cytosine967-C5)-methyltransferase
MNDAGGMRLQGAVAAFAAWQAGRCSPRDAVAYFVPRDLPPAARAEIAAVVYAAVRDQRRLTWALGGAPEHLDGDDRAGALVLAAAVAQGQLDAAAAARRWQARGGEPLPFAAVPDCEARIAALPDPQQRFALRHSLPDWLAARMLAEFGADADTVAAALNRPPPRAIRANRLRGADRSALARDLADAGVSTGPTPFAPDGLLVADDAALFALPQYRAGRFEQQDEGSQLVALAVAPPPRGKVLDACAGAGGKALALAAMLGNQGLVLAVDVSATRIAALQQRARRAGADNLRAMVVAEGGWPADVAAFAARADRILLDVPCSGTGSWRRRPEARWISRPGELDTLLPVQRDLLDRAAAALQPGARLVYATCSLWRQENEDQVAAALARHPQLEVVRLAEIVGGALARAVGDADGTFLHLRPDRHGTDGFFAAVLRRRRGAALN